MPAQLLVERYVALEALAPFVADEFVVKSDDVHDVAQILGRNLAFLPVSLRIQCDGASLVPPLNDVFRCSKFLLTSYWGAIYCERMLIAVRGKML